MLMAHGWLNASQVALGLIPFYLNIKFRYTAAVMIKRDQGSYFDPGLIPFYLKKQITLHSASDDCTGSGCALRPKISTEARCLTNKAARVLVL